jgi:phosphatidylglycerophosphatase A
VSDHPAIVWDEVIGMALTLLAVPLTWPQYLLGFALFRLFDIVKPWPVGALDRQVGGGLGVMLDDIAAGVLAGVTLQLVVLAAQRLA